LTEEHVLFLMYDVGNVEYGVMSRLNNSVELHLP
jgi:hypothetical protein